MEENIEQKKIPPAVERQQKELNIAAKKLVDLLQQCSKLEANLKNEEKNLKENGSKTANLSAEEKRLSNELEIQKKKSIVIQKIQEFVDFHSKLEDSFARKDYKSILDNMRQLEHIAPTIKQEKALENVKNDSAQKLRLLFNDILISKERSLTFPSDEKFKIVYRTLLHFSLERDFVFYIVNFLSNNLLSVLNNQNCNVVIKTLGNKSITLIEREEPHTPTTSLTESYKLIDEFSKTLTSVGFLLQKKELRQLGNQAIELGIAHTGGLLIDTEKAVKQLCKLCYIDNINMNELAKQSKLPQTLEKCRTMMKEGKLFGEAVDFMMSIFEGTPSDGILTKLSILALVEWKNDSEKLKTAFPIFIAIGTNEAIQCMMMFQERLNELKAQK